MSSVNYSSTRFTVGPRLATLMIVSTALCFGLVPLFARELQQSGTGSATIALYRYAISALLLLPFIPLQRDKRAEALLIGVAGFLMGLSWIAYLEAIKVTSIAMAGVIYMSYPLFAMIFAWLMVGQRPTLRSGTAGVMILIAALLALAPASLPVTSISTLLWSLAAPVAFGFIIVVVSACLKKLSTLERMACAMSGAFIGLAPIASVQNAGDFIPAVADQWIWVFGIAIFTAFLPQLLYSYAAPRVGPTRCAVAGCVEMPTMFAVGWLVFGEALSWREVLAAVLILIAILITPVIQARSE